MKKTILYGLSMGVGLAVLWSVVYTRLLGTAGIGIGIALGVAFGCSGALIGRVADNKHREHQQYTDKKEQKND